VLLSVGRVAVEVSGVNWDLELRDLLKEAGLTAVPAERVNMPAVSSSWSVTSRGDAAAA
jgi:hypothetical protein